MFQMSDEYLHQKELEKQRSRDNKKKATKFSAKFKATLAEAITDVENAKISILLRFIIILAIVADLFGLIPVAGTFIGFFFGIILFVLYFLNGLGKGFIKGDTKKQIRKRSIRWIRKTFLMAVEGVPMFSWLPLFTIEALIEYTLSKKSLEKKIKKLKKIKKSIKKFK